jgi:hypothetical protein
MRYLISYKKLCGNDHIVNKSGQEIEYNTLRRSEPKKAKVEKTLVDIYSGEITKITDTEQTIYNRNNKFYQFRDIYVTRFLNREISLIEFVIKDIESKSISLQISDLKKKLKRKDITVYSSIWIRDTGNIKYENHIHWLVATDRIGGTEFKHLFSNNSTDNYEVRFAKSIHGRIKYFSKKPLYGSNGQATYHVAKFNLPK